MIAVPSLLNGVGAVFGSVVGVSYDPDSTLFGEACPPRPPPPQYVQYVRNIYIYFVVYMVGADVDIFSWVHMAYMPALYT